MAEREEVRQRREAERRSDARGREAEKEGGREQGIS